MIYICTINWKNPRHTLNFLKSLKCLEHKFHLLLWINEPLESNCSGLREEDYREELAFNENLVDFTYIECSKNIGQTVPWNTALQESREMGCDMCWCVNNDVFFNKSVNNLIKFQNARPEFGLVSPSLFGRDVDFDENNSKAEKLEYTENCIVDNLNGPLMSIPKHLIDDGIQFDPMLRYSFEDMDMVEEVKNRGCGVCEYTGTRIWHYGGASTSLHDIGVPKVNNIYWDRFNAKRGK